MTTITTLPPAPNRSDPSTFASKADSFVSALPTLVTEINTVVGEINTAANNTSTKAGEALASANTATTKATEASASAVLSEAWATSTSVVSGGLYGARKYAQDALSYANDAASIVGHFLGEKLIDPLLNNEGGALVGGNWYVNVTPGSEAIRVYTGTGWIAGISAVAGVSSINGMTGSVSFTVPSGKLYYMGTA